jgi:D-alanyl-D-alanine dipeptidase
VVDVALFLLLVSAAAFSVVTATAAEATPTEPVARDEATVETLATTTATVRYDLGADSRTNETITRVTHGTLAELLAEAAVAAVAVDGERSSPYASGFVGAVHDVVQPVLNRRTQVVATWTPYPHSTLAGRVRIGPSPPPDATVHAATLDVDSGYPASRPASGEPATTGYAAVADTVATQVVDGQFPSRETAVALDGGGSDATVIRTRFASMRSAYGVNTSLEADVTAARTDLTGAMSTRIRAELQREFASPGDAAAAVRIDRVTILVRTWS